MKKSTREWIEKAEEDFSVAAGLARRRKVPANSVCFSCQQMAEKYLKGLLQENSIHFAKTHDLEMLSQSAQTFLPSLALLSNDFDLLTDYAVKFRYPGNNATPAMAKAALLAAKRVRSAIRLALGQ